MYWVDDKLFDAKIIHSRHTWSEEYNKALYIDYIQLTKILQNHRPWNPTDNQILQVQYN